MIYNCIRFLLYDLFLQKTFSCEISCLRDDSINSYLLKCVSQDYAEIIVQNNYLREESLNNSHLKIGRAEQTFYFSFVVIIFY